jgi:hypothetical protein
MKHILLIAFSLFFINAGWSQASSEFINREIAKVENYIKKGDSTQKLTNEQKVAISKILETKESALLGVINQKLSKKETSELVRKVENDYLARIESVLTIEQRLIISEVKTSMSFNN